MQDKRAMQAMKVMDASIAESDTATIRAENERLKAQIESQQLREAVDRRGAPDEWREFMLHQIEALQGKADEASRATADAQQSLLQERLGMLQSELSRVQTQPPVDQLAMVSQTIDQAQAIMSKMTAKSDGAVAHPAPVDSALERLRLTAELQREERRLEFEERRADRLAELELRREKQTEELRIQQRRADLEERFFSETAPKLLDMGQRLVATWASRVESPLSSAPATPAAVAPAAVGATLDAYPRVGGAPPATNAPPPSLPPGVKAMPCQQCGAMIYYREEFGGVICFRCGVEYLNEHSTAHAGGEGVAYDAAGPATVPGEQGPGANNYTPGDRGTVDTGTATSPS
jgi:hypothetical protein